MGDRITKFLKTLSAKQRAQAIGLIERIIVGNLGGLDVKKLTGYANAFRVRKGDLRIVFTMKAGKADIFVLEWRSESTYRF